MGRMTTNGDDRTRALRASDLPSRRDDDRNDDRRQGAQGARACFPYLNPVRKIQGGGWTPSGSAERTNELCRSPLLANDPDEPSGVQRVPIARGRRVCVAGYNARVLVLEVS